MGKRAKPKTVADFFPKAKPVKVLKGPKGGEVRVTRWLKPRSWFPPLRWYKGWKANRFFGRRGIEPDYEPQKIKPLSDTDTRELKRLLKYDEPFPIQFYHDNRDLFIAYGDCDVWGNSFIRLHRLRKNGRPEPDYYARMKYWWGGKGAQIGTVYLNRKHLSGWINRNYSRPKPAHSGRGLLPAFVHFIQKQGFDRVEAGKSTKIVKRARPAYLRAGFREEGGRMVWTAPGKSD